MPKLRVTAIHKETVVFDSGDIPKRAIETLLEENDGNLTGSSTGWGLSDVGRGEWETTEITVEEIGKRSR